MAITGFPLRTKYAYNDSVYIFENGKIVPVTIASWRVEVDNPSGDGDTGRQLTFYRFSDRTDLEIEQSYVFASENAVLFWLKGDFINRANESGSGGNSFFGSGYNNAKDPKSYGNWTDFAGFDLANMELSFSYRYVALTGTVSITSGSYVLNGVGTQFLTELAANQFFIINGTDICQVNYEGPISDTVVNLAAIASITRTGVSIADIVDTRDLNTYQGTIAMTTGSDQMIGTDTKFQDELEIGDVVTIDGTEDLTVESIESQTALTTTTNAVGDWSAGEYLITAYVTGEVELLYESGGEKTLVFDYADLHQSGDAADNLPVELRTKADFMENVRSFDAETTIWIDYEPIGYPD